MADLVALLRDGLVARADPDAAIGMQAYMKSAMPFRGVPKPGRQQVLAEALRRAPPVDAAAVRATATRLWGEAEVREERYLALSLVGRRAGWIDPSWVPVLRGWIVEGAWWDFTDEIASRLLGPLLRSHPAELTPTMYAWTADSDRWLRRTSVIVQLGAKDAVDLDLLTAAVDANIRDPDFFLRKGIGWALRQHARVDPEWVRAFVAARPALSPLSRREALRHIDP